MLKKIHGTVIWHAKSKKDLHGTLSSRLKDLIYMVFVFLFPIIPTIQIFSAFEKVGQTCHDSRQGCCLWLWCAQVQMFHLHGGTWEAESSPHRSHFSDDPRISSLAETKDVVGVPSYLCLPKPSVTHKREKKHVILV